MSGFIRIHILHHATQPEGTYGLWMIGELSRHGYQVSPGTIYPILGEMERDGLLRSEYKKAGKGRRKVYRTTVSGREALEELRAKVRELYLELES